MRVPSTLSKEENLILQSYAAILKSTFFPNPYLPTKM